MIQAGFSPLISVITPVYNGSQYLEELIRSVQSQDYPSIEHIIIDDGSRDEGATIAVLKLFPHLRWWSRKNEGQYATMNEGLLAAQGEFVCFVSADDLVAPGALTSACNFFKSNPRVDGCFGRTSFIDAEGNHLSYPLPFPLAPLGCYPYFAHIPHCSIYLRRIPLQNHDLYFDPSLRYVGDYDWIIRISKSRLRMGVVKQELSKVRIHPSQTTQLHLEACRIEKQRVVKNHSLNIFVYSLLSGVNVLFMRILKIGIIYEDAGIKGIIKRLSNWLRRRLRHGEMSEGA